MKTYDLAVIGAGPGGYHAAIIAAQHGLSVLLAERDALGGTCLNRGCIPTKSFLADTGLLEKATHSPVLTGTDKLKLDLKAMVARKNKVVTTMVTGLSKIMDSHGITVVSGQARLEGPGRIRIGPRLYKAENIILALGSRPAVPGFIPFDGKLIQTTDQALDPASVPSRLGIIGGGVIGLEFAAVFMALGTKVTILEMLPDILYSEDQEVRRTIRLLMARSGVEIRTATKVLEVNRAGETVELIHQNQAGKSMSLTVDRVLVATGRVPVLDGIDPQRLGLEMNGPYVKVDSFLRTNLAGVYAIGDLVGGMMLAHKASAEAEAAVENILGGAKTVDPDLIPRCIWCRPEVAAVGLTEDQARESGRRVRAGRFNLPNSGKAQAMGEIDGFVKIIADRDNGEILGVHMVGEHVTDMIGEVLMAKTMEAAVEDLAGVIMPHPTLSENIKEAALDWSGLAIHALKQS